MAVVIAGFPVIVASLRIKTTRVGDSIQSEDRAKREECHQRKAILIYVCLRHIVPRLLLEFHATPK